ncbi:hypothetical protein F441_21592 [Phytophthora nicotianae CJ01A1]|uniref:Uncharacterized protein n=6 Tax=Phytophthora nicotianae TaxID=4792 RepID=W2QT09_PHYN3|nr:hypothetical protein PPTG_21891 [Phytophthora nicotianae INRA-310]ETI31329.1 hypothetical protein F443_21702 [Phytophthora nicotianae P1569]ETK71707.1 hypothetical protein L915_21102 [Phytophthora nicotianae]ETO60032.1 hypothetical protein F444_21734 [Phytophthora nicotianae P1976]ETP01134.1 hypothetical protein F441_21592 [Phytophthora nicotianae CJ01A1]ETP29286.1 hypothetical protein F442_21558 [Phytophthora nicotianae P10297]
MARRRRTWDASRSTTSRRCAMTHSRSGECPLVRNWKNDGHFNQLVSVIGRCDSLGGSMTR